MKQVSASNVEAFYKCTSSHILPQHESYQSFTEAGTDGHALLCPVLNRVPGAAGRLEAELPGLHVKIAELMNGVSESSGEDAYVVDVEKRTSVHIGRNINRKYAEALGRPLTRFEIPCSMDAIGMKGGLPWVRDFKFGITSSWWQLHIQSMALLWRDNYQTEVDAGFIFIDTHTEKNAIVTEEQAMVYISDLDDRADELMESFARADEIEAWLAAGHDPSGIRTVQGKWCTYCGAYPFCPSKWTLVKSMLGMDLVGSVAALSPEDCGNAWKKLAEIEKNIISKTKDALKQRMRVEGGFPLENGKMLRVLPMVGRVGFNREGAIDLLRRLGASEDEILSLVKRGDSYDSVRETKP